MDDTGYLKESLKQWIKTTPSMSRCKLASLCGISKRTLDNWLTKNGSIPEAKKTILELALSGNNKRKKNNFYKVSLNFSLEEFKQMEELAGNEKITVKRWIESLIKKSMLSCL